MFKGKIFNDTIEKYKRLVSDFEQLTRKEVVAKLAANLPSFTREATQNSEVGILQRNIRNNGATHRKAKVIEHLLPLEARRSNVSISKRIILQASKHPVHSTKKKQGKPNGMKA